MQVLVLHGPNLNLLGEREPESYGSEGLAGIDRSLVELAGELRLRLDHYQSNHEGSLVDRIQEAGHVAGLVVNAGGLTHSSVALRDALLAVRKPFVEVHCSNVWKREEFRQRSLLSDVAVGVVAGFGPESYRLGLRALAHHLGAPGGA